MRPNLRYPHTDFSVRRLPQCITQIQPFAPSGSIFHRYRFAEQLRSNVPHCFSQLQYVCRPRSIDRLTRVHQRSRPGLQRRGCATRPLQDCVSLAQHPPIATPGRQIGMFHVEHAPIQESTPLSRATFHQLMQPRTNRLYPKGRRQIKKPLPVGAVNTDLKATIVISHAQTMATRLTRPGASRTLAKYRQTRLAALHKLTQLTGTKGPPTAQQKDRLQQAGLSRAIRSKEIVAPRMQREIGLRYAAHAFNTNPAEGHEVSSAPITRRAGQSRIGITTNLPSSLPTSVIRQLEFESVTPRLTCSPSTAASASSR